MKRWFFWYIRKSGSSEWQTTRPEYLTDPEAQNLEFRTRFNNFGAELYRLVYEPRVNPNAWIFDPRNDRELLAGAPIRKSPYT